MRNFNVNSFQRCGAAAWNARSPRVESILPLGGSNKMPELDLILYEDLLITRRCSDSLLCAKPIADYLFSDHITE